MFAVIRDPFQGTTGAPIAQYSIENMAREGKATREWYTEGKAIEEAQRLAARYPHYSWYVVKVVGAAEAVQVSYRAINGGV